METLRMVYDALDENRVKVFYQPQFEAESCKLVSAEALCRIENEYHELIMPGEFIPVLEKQESPDAIRNFDWYIFTQVCRFLSRLRRNHMRPIPISVNLSRRHLLSNPTELYLENTAKQLSIPHKFLDVEITENAEEEDPMELQRLIYKIRTQGFRVAIDDFGSGQANFKFLIDNQVDIIKLDQSFIARKCKDPRERAVLGALINLAKHDLGMTVVAEGVEDPEQWEFLKEQGCDLIQGYLFSEPLDEDEFINIYHNGLKDF